MTQRGGVLAIQQIRDLIKKGHIKASKKIPEGSLQPATLDLRVSAGEVVRLPGMFLPGKGDVFKQALDLSRQAKLNYGSPVNTEGFMIEVGIPYLLPIMEEFDLPKEISARVNNKSSSGRVNLQIKLICENSQEFDMIPAGYKGKIYAVAVAQSFPIHVKPGEALSQMRFYSKDVGNLKLSESELREAHESHGLVYDGKGQKVPWEKVQCSNSSIVFTANLRGEGDVAGYCFKGTATDGLWFSDRNVDPSKYFDPIYTPKHSDYLMLAKGGFYILATNESFSVPEFLCAEMVAYQEGMGEYRSHFAGFFDPGWGYNQGLKGASVVLEIIPHENIMLFHGQPVCAMSIYAMEEAVENLYGDTGSHYHGQTGPRLGKQFASFPHQCRLI